MDLENGNRLVTTHLQMAIGMYQKILWKIIKTFKNNITLIIRYIFNFHGENSFIFRITEYATASTSDSVLIIGGYTNGLPSRTSTIAEFSDGNWKNVGNLAQARRLHGAVTSGSIIMVVGGYPLIGST